MRRGLPISVARDPDVLLAWQMNGDDLPAVHGGPVRLIVPGWGAIASTKWLIGLELIDHRFDGYWNADNYMLYDESGAATGPVTLMPVKSLIATPAPGRRSRGAANNRRVRMVRPRRHRAGGDQHRRRGVMARGPDRGGGRAALMGAVRAPLGPRSWRGAAAVPGDRRSRQHPASACSLERKRLPNERNLPNCSNGGGSGISRGEPTGPKT